ncbi:MAG: pyruvate kinase, partial [Gemmatimonadetes bacterium]|nr:pyruvate kinase [Gemmatimonadota bacterium]
VVKKTAETAIGDYPDEAVQAIDRNIRRIEGSALPGMDRAGRMPAGERAQVQKSASGAISAAAVEAVERLGASCIVTLTRSGFTARVVASQRPPVPILAITDQWRTYNQLALVWGVQPLLYRGELSFEGMRAHARKEVRRLGLGSSGDRYVVTAGVPFHVAGTTNLMRIEQL